MASSFTYGLQDSSGGKSYHGATIAAAITPSQVTTFVNAAIAPFSDAAHIQSAVKSTVDVTGNTPGGTTGIERRGQVILKNTADGRRFVITIPAVSAASISPNGQHKASLTTACCDAVLAAFNTLSGLTCLYVSSYADGSQFQR